MRSFVYSFTALLCFIYYLFSLTSQVYAQTPSNGLYIGTSSTITAGQTPVHTNPGTAYATPRALPAGTTYILQRGSGNYTISGLISGSGDLVIDIGSGNTLTLSFVNTYTGTTTIESGILKIQDGASAITVKNRATLELYGSAGRNHSFSMTLEDGSTLVKSSTNWSTFDSHDITVNGRVEMDITNSPSASKNEQLYIGGSRTGLRGSGTLTINNTGNIHTGLTIRGTGPNHFKGTLIVRGGRLGLGEARGNSVAGTALDSTSIRLQNSAKFLISDVSSTDAVNASVKSLGGETDTEVKLGSKTLTLGTDNGSGSYAGAISGRGAVKKVGTDTVTLSGANTYAGGTRVEKGVLKVSGSLASAVTVDGGKLMGTGTVPSVTLRGTAGSTLSGGSGSGHADTLTISGALVSQAGTLEVYSSGTSVSTVKANTASGHLIVDLMEPISLGGSQTLTLTLISCANENSSMKARIGDNQSGYNARVAWTSDTGLQLFLGGTPGLYQDNDLTTPLIPADSPTHTEDITLADNRVFLEVKGENSVIYELRGVISGNTYGIDTRVDSLILSRNNSYTGNTTISSGVLQIGNGGTSGTLGSSAGAVTVERGAVLQFKRGNEITVANVIAGSGTLVQNGTDTLILTGINTHSGKKEIRSGSLQVGDGGRSGDIGTGEVSISGGASLIYNRSSDLEWASSLSFSGMGSIVKRGTGDLTLNATPTDYRGTVMVEADKLKIQDWTSAITVKNRATLELYGGAAREHNFPLTLEKGSTLLKSNSGYNTFNNHDITVNGNAKIEITNNPSNNQQLYIGGSSAGLRGSDTLTIDNTEGNTHTGLTIRGTGPNHFKGTLVVKGGSLGLGDLSGNTVAGTASLALDSASVRLENSAVFLISDVEEATAVDASVKSLGGAGGTEVKLGAQTLTLGTANGSGSYAGVISDGTSASGGQLKKVGSGKQELTEVNTYTGTTRVEGGILEIGSNGSLHENSSVTIEGGALGGVGTVNGAVTLKSASGSAIYGGSGPDNAGNLTLAGNFTAERGGVLKVYSSADGSRVSKLTVNGIVTGHLIVNLEQAIDESTDPYTILSTPATSSTLTAELGVNKSTHGARLKWDPSIGLQVIVGVTVGLYLDNDLTTPLVTAGSPTHTEDIILADNRVFLEVKGENSVIYELSGIISETAGATFGIETQVDTLILTGNNTYTGATTVRRGVLQIGKDGTSGSLDPTGTVTVERGAVLQFQRSNNITVGNVIAGAGTLVQNGTDTLILTETNTHSGKKEIRSGSLQVGSGESTGSITGEVAIATGASLIYNRSDAVEWARAITVSGPGSIVKRGTGTLTLKATHNNYRGTVMVDTDTLKIEDWTSPITVKNRATLELPGSTGKHHTFPLTLEEGSTLLKSNTGYNTFNSYDVTVNGRAEIKINNSPRVNNDQQLYIGGPTTGLRGSGTLTIDNNGGNEYTGLTIRGTGTKHFKGTLVIKGGRLGIGDSRGNSVAGMASLALDSASINLQNSAVFLISDVAEATAVDASVKSLGGAGGTEVKLGSQTLTLGTDNGKSNYAGVISGTGGSLKKVGTDTVSLSGVNTYTGASRVEQGVLKVSRSLTSPVTIAGGKLMGTGTVPSVTLTNTAGSALSGGNGPGNADTLKISGLLTGAAGAKLEVYSSGSNVSTVTAGEVSGNLTVDLKEPITTSSLPTTITLIKCIHSGSSMTHSLGLNNSGYNDASVQWVPGTGLQVILKRSAPGLYRDGTALTTSSTPYSTDIRLTQNTVFTEVKGTSHVTYELSGIISGEHGIDTRVDTLILTGENTYSGATKVSSGVLQIGKGSTVGKLGPGPVNLLTADSELLYKHGGTAHTVVNAIGGLGKLTQAGTDTLILTGANTYTGPTQVQQGALRVSGSLSASAVTVSGGALCGSGTVKSVILSNTAGSLLFGGNGAGHADTLTISGALTGSGGALNVYSSIMGLSTKISHVKAHSASGNVVVNIEGVLPTGTHTLISCADSRSGLTATLGKNNTTPSGCVLFSWEPGVGLKAEVRGTSAVSATLSVNGSPAEQGSTTQPRVTFTGSGGTAPYTFTYKIDQGSEKTARGTGTLSTAEVGASTTTVGNFVYNLVKVLDSRGCFMSLTGQQVTVTITAKNPPTPPTGDLPKPGETLHLYPIPARDQIVIRSAKVLGRVQLRDLQGRVLIEHEPSSSQEVELSVADLSPGIYIVEVEEGQHLRRVKLSKE